MKSDICSVWFVILSIYIVWICIAMSTTLVDGDYGFSKTPKEIYNTTNFNMFGCTLLWIFFVAINPLGFLFRFIYFLFHVGRKHKEEDDYFGI